MCPHTRVRVSTATACMVGPSTHLFPCHVDVTSHQASSRTIPVSAVPSVASHVYLNLCLDCIYSQVRSNMQSTYLFDHSVDDMDVGLDRVL